MTMHKFILTITAILTIPVLMIGFQVDGWAHSGAKGIVKERMDSMKSIGAQMKKLGAIVKDPQLFDASQVQNSAKILQGHAEKIPELFPKGSNEKPSEARVEIWSDWDKFVSIANDLVKSAVELQTVSADNFKPVFLKAAQTCKGCHQEYRIKK